MQTVEVVKALKNRMINPEKQPDFGPGWSDILAQLDHELCEILPGYGILECRERSGSLSFEIPHTKDYHLNNRMRAAIQRASLRARNTCDECGDRGILRRVGLQGFKTRCPEHSD